MGFVFQKLIFYELSHGLWVTVTQHIINVENIFDFTFNFAGIEKLENKQINYKFTFYPTLLIEAMFILTAKRQLK